MSQPFDGNAKLGTGPLSSERVGVRREHQETLLLSDVPDASALLSEAVPGDAPTGGAGPSGLAALGERYDILGEAGHGSMGNVYKARDRETGETVALKILKPEIASDQAMMDRFKNELLFARKITHKNVCRVHDFNRIGGIACTSMEFVDGESLRSVLNRFGGLPFRKAIDVAQQICSGLKEAHAQGIVHRDLKPENVMVDVQGNVKIMDFGIARSMEASTRLTSSMVGTPAYMAPEQVSGKAVDYRTDIYSLGLMLYEMFTGVQAFHADTPIAVAMKQIREAPPLPRDAEPSIPLHVERAILKCLEKDPPKRFQSVSELQKALRASGATATNSAASPSPVPSHSSHTSSTVPGVVAGRSKRRSPMLVAIFIAAFTLAGLAAVRQWKPARSGTRARSSTRLASSKNAAQSSATSAASAPTLSVSATPKSESGAATSNLIASTKQRPAENSHQVELPAKSPTGAAHTAAGHANPLTASAPNGLQPDVHGTFGPGVYGPASSNGYLFMGRFESEDRADRMAKRITDLGLPVTVLPRGNAKGQFFAVVSGPFGRDRIESVRDWLKTQGFANVRMLRVPEENQTPNARKTRSSGPGGAL